MYQTGATGYVSGLKPWDAYKPQDRKLVGPTTGFKNQQTMHKSSIAISTIGAAVLLGGVALIVLGSMYSRSFAIIPTAVGIGAGSVMVAIGSGGIGYSVYLFKKGYWNDPKYLEKVANEVQASRAITYSEIVQKYDSVVSLNKIISEQELFDKYVAESGGKTFKTMMDEQRSQLGKDNFVHPRMFENIFKTEANQTNFTNFAQQYKDQYNPFLLGVLELNDDWWVNNIKDQFNQLENYEKRSLMGYIADSSQKSEHLSSFDRNLWSSWIQNFILYFSTFTDLLSDLDEGVESRGAKRLGLILERGCLPSETTRIATRQLNEFNAALSRFEQMRKFAEDEFKTSENNAASMLASTLLLFQTAVTNLQIAIRTENQNYLDALSDLAFEESMNNAAYYNSVSHHLHHHHHRQGRGWHAHRAHNVSAGMALYRNISNNLTTDIKRNMINQQHTENLRGLTWNLSKANSDLAEGTKIAQLHYRNAVIAAGNEKSRAIKHTQDIFNQRKREIDESFRMGIVDIKSKIHMPIPIPADIHETEPVTSAFVGIQI